MKTYYVMHRFLFFILILLLTFLFSGCDSSEPFTVMAHGTLWGTKLPTLPSATNTTLFPIAWPAHNATKFFGFWFILYTKTPGEITCFVKEFYDNRTTFNSTVFLLPLDFAPAYQGNVFSEGFRTNRIKPHEIRYDYTCTRNLNETYTNSHYMIPEYTYSEN